MKRLLAVILSLCLILLLIPPFSAIAANEVNIQFNSMDSITNLDMEPDTNGKKSVTLYTPSLEGTGAVKFAYEAGKNGGLFWYLRTPNSTSIDISNATHITFDMYISNINGWNISASSDKRLGFRAASSSTWDTAAGQVTAADMSTAFNSLKSGWNHLVMPITLGSNASTLSGIRMYIAAGTAGAGFYIIIDDVRFVNQSYLNSTTYANDIERKQSIIRAQKGEVCVNFNNMDNSSRHDMEDVATKSKSLTTERLEGTGAVKFAYIADKTSGGHFYYFRCPTDYNSTGIDITGATHVTFDIYVSDMSKWTRSGDSRFGLRSLDSSINGTWDTSAGQVTSANMNSTFNSLTNGWNRVVMPIDTSSATSSMVWGIRMYFAGGTGASGFYIIVDDIRFVNQKYLDSDEYKQKCNVENVIINISKLPAASSINSSHVTTIQTARADYNALSATDKAKVYNIDNLIAAENVLGSAYSVVNIPFRSLDTADRTAQEAATTPSTTNIRVEGTGAAQFEIAVDTTDLAWYIYCESAVASTGVNIASATHMIFDFYVNDLSLVNFSEASNMLLNVRNVSTTGWWDSSCTHVTNQNLRSVFDNIKQGWNHVVLPIETPLTNDAFAFRMTMIGATAKQEFYSIIDDIRFVNQNYLNSVEYSNIIAAKSVAGKISELTKNSPASTLSTVRTAYNNLTETQKSLVCNYSWLTTFEGGNDLLENAAKTFSTIPSNHLAARQTTAAGEFSLAVLSDLHYAVNYNGQEKDVFYNSIDWILNNAKKENTLMTLQLGDITSSNRYAQWKTIRPGFQKLVDGGMPYATVIGNHDIGGQSNAAYNYFLPYSEQVSSNPYLAGAYKEGKTENLYYTFKVNGIKYMVLTLTCYPKGDVLTWADKVIKAHADHNVILVTHSYLRTVNGMVERTVETEALAEGFTGDSLWNSIIKPNPNVLVTLSAHNSYPSPGGNGVGYRTDTNDYGRTVYQFLVPDPQTYEASYGGLGSCFLMRFSNQGKTLSCEYISTRYDKDIIVSGNSNHVVTLNAVTPDPDIEAANAVDALIDAIGTVTLDSQSAITTARNAYSNLTDIQKGYVNKLSVLEKAEITLNELILASMRKYGDIDNDSEITATDALLILQCTVDKITLTDDQKAVAELNGDGIIDVSDALLTLQKTVDKIDKFPIEK